jgi:VanZ family protein
MSTAPQPFPKSVRRSAAVIAAGMAAVIFYFSLVPAEEAPGADVSDKLRHFVAYASLAIPVSVWLGPRRWLATVALVSLMGVGAEVAQAIAPTGREPSFGDALANACGAGLGTGLVWLSLRLRRRG